ncbi:Y_sulf_Ax21, sulfation-dependent quorum factor, Ax21 family [Oxalobacteraceae bacterium]
MKFKKSIIASALLLPAMAWAQDSSSKTNGLTYNYVGIGYANIMIDTTYRATLHGTSIEGSKLVNENFYVFGNYFSTSTDQVKFLGNTLEIDVNFRQYQLSAGYRRALQPGTDVIASIGAVNASTRLNSGSSTEGNIYPVSVGIKRKLTDSIEAAASGIIVSGDFASVVNLQYKFSDLYAIGGYFRHDPNSTIYALNVHYLF